MCMYARIHLSSYIKNYLEGLIILTNLHENQTQPYWYADLGIFMKELQIIHSFIHPVHIKLMCKATVMVMAPRLHELKRKSLMRNYNYNVICQP